MIYQYLKKITQSEHILNFLQVGFDIYPIKQKTLYGLLMLAYITHVTVRSTVFIPASHYSFLRQYIDPN